jgi:nanoRNase/pAp phosphatase (c-di-AMP/oligoRNAs hydrolase)
MEVLGIQVLEDASIDDYDAVVVLDTATPNQLEDWGEKVMRSSVKKIFIDHHTPHPSMIDIADYTMIDESATSTCELVYRIYSSWGVEPTPVVARALLLGITYDSRHLSIATPTTLKTASVLSREHREAQGRPEDAAPRSHELDFSHIPAELVPGLCG